MSTTSLHQRFSCRENGPRLLKIVTTTGLLNRHVDFFMLLRSESITTLAHDLIPVTPLFHVSLYICMCAKKLHLYNREQKNCFESIQTSQLRMCPLRLLLSSCIHFQINNYTVTWFLSFVVELTCHSRESTGVINIANTGCNYCVWWLSGTTYWHLSETEPSLMLLETLVFLLLLTASQGVWTMAPSGNCLCFQPTYLPSPSI